MSGNGQRMDENNDTCMSGGDAFQAFLSKNDGGEEEDDEWVRVVDVSTHLHICEENNI